MNKMELGDEVIFEFDKKRTKGTVVSITPTYNNFGVEARNITVRLDSGQNVFIFENKSEDIVH